MDSSDAPIRWHAQRPGRRGEPLHALPLVTLYLTERCNSRCVSCDYWRHGRRDMQLDELQQLLPGLRAMGTRVVLVSGGEPLLNPHWAEMAALMRAQGLRLWLLSAGLALAKHAAAVAGLFESLTVSLDGSTRASYLAIRGVDAFDKVCEGIRAAAALGLPAGLRVTVQRANCRELPSLVKLARELGAASISFLAADVGHGEAFGRLEGSGPGIALQAEDLPALAEAIDTLERDHADDFASGFILESPTKLRRLHAYSRALCGLGEFPPVRCNAPEFSAVVEADGALRPCFFIAGTEKSWDLAAGINAQPMQALRADIRDGQRSECVRCVCAKWRDPAEAFLA